ncbi:hypothetical protein ACFQ60_02235 [Streptomyces zhihengii]
MRRKWPEAVGKQPDRSNQRDVFGCAHGSQQGKSNGDRASIGPVSDQPAARLANAVSARPLSRGSDVPVLVNRDVDVVEGIGQFAGQGRNLGEMRVQDEGNVLAAEGRSSGAFGLRR